MEECSEKALSLFEQIIEKTKTEITKSSLLDEDSKRRINQLQSSDFLKREAVLDAFTMREEL